MANNISTVRLNRKSITLTIIGDTPLICHAWSDKTLEEMKDKQDKQTKSTGKGIRDRYQEYRSSLYEFAPKHYGFPAMGLKLAAANAARHDKNLTIVGTKGAFFIIVPREQYIGTMPLVKLNATQLVPAEDVVRVGGRGSGTGAPDFRYRGYFWDWSTTFEIEYDAGVISDQQIVSLFDIAGFHTGIGDWRPEKGGQYGRFHVQREGEEPYTGEMEELPFEF